MRFIFLILLFTSSVLADNNGWGPLKEKLIKDGISPHTIKIFDEKDFPKFKEVTFRLAPKESHDIYVRFTDPGLISKGKSFIYEFADTFDKVERVFQVHQSIITAILLVETNLGANTGKELVLNRLSRIGNIGTKENIEWNYQRLNKLDSTVTKQQVEERAQYLVNTFYPEVLTLLKLHEDGILDARTLKGSIAGAFGFPQFLPTSLINFGIDGNGNGSVNLFEMEDAIWSVGKYFHLNGWKDNGSITEKRSAIWKYNKSDAYIDTILRVAALLKRA